ncbi:MAG: hypothetical protein J5I93_20470, partial [Pirellulaceae bacterium]|nr:hypothetical protein [Pirellulaceae bacterium]
MHFRQSGMRDERRRRVLIDETVTGGEEQPAAPAAPPSSKTVSAPSAYAPAALAPERHRLLNLVPLRAWTIWVLTLSSLAVIAGILSLHAGVFHESAVVLDRQAIRALDVTAYGSLAGWFSSLLLTLGAVSSLLLYALRRHRTDDYRGYYRIWLWASAGLWWASIDAATGIHSALGAALQLLTGVPLDGDGSGWWLGLYGLVFGGLAVRMLLEIRQCRLAVLSLLGAGALYGGLAAVTLSLLPLDGALLDQLLRGTLELLAHGSVLLAVVLFTRHVVLEAQGKLPARRPPAARPKKTRQPRSAKGQPSADDEASPAGATKGKRRAATTRVDSAHDDARSRPR